MTDRFYPLGSVTTDPDAWKTSYEVMNEMRSFDRSPYPPGCAVHMPGARAKYGFSNPGPLAHRLAQPESCPQGEEVDVPNPREYHAMPRMQVPDDRETFGQLDVPEIHRSYNSPVAKAAMTDGFDGKKSGGFRMSRASSVPSLRNTVRSRLCEPEPQIDQLEDDHFSYFVPKSYNREGKSKILSMSIPKLQKSNRVTMPFAGDGTGYRCQSSNTGWWPEGQRMTRDQPTAYRSQFCKKHPFFRISPLAPGTMGTGNPPWAPVIAGGA